MRMFLSVEKHTHTVAYDFYTHINPLSGAGTETEWAHTHQLIVALIAHAHEHHIVLYATFYPENISVEAVGGTESTPYLHLLLPFWRTCTETHRIILHIGCSEICIIVFRHQYTLPSDMGRAASYSEQLFGRVGKIVSVYCGISPRGR